MKSARIEEIFSSIQGEGPWIGERHIFIRFKGCDIRCRYCDTPAAGEGEGPPAGEGVCRAQRSAVSLEYEQVSDVFSRQRLSDFCSRLIISGPSRPTLSLTGGEPLLHHEFLSTWLPEVGNTYRIYLETNGIQHRAMDGLRELVDVVSMDFKLPSATGLQPFWEEHKKFLSAARGTALFVKAVVTADTAREDILTSATIIAGYDASVPLIIQPAGGRFAPEPALLIDFQNAALGIIRNVRVIPQVHKILNVP